jgi:small subunit ribosomal protein S21
MVVRIVIRDREPIGLALRRFKQQLQAHGVVWEMWRRRYFADPTDLRRQKKFQKRFKARKATLFAKMAAEQPDVGLARAKAAFRKRSGKP